MRIPLVGIKKFALIIQSKLLFLSSEDVAKKYLTLTEYVFCGNIANVEKKLSMYTQWVIHFVQVGMVEDDVGTRSVMLFPSFIRNLYSVLLYMQKLFWLSAKKSFRM